LLGHDVPQPLGRHMVPAGTGCWSGTSSSTSIPRRSRTRCAANLDYSRDSVIETAGIRVKGLLNWEND
jgi:hypothetical protein